MTRITKDQNKKGLLWINLLAFFIILAVVTLMLYRTDLMHFFMSKERLLHFMQSLGPWAALGLIVLQAVQVIVSPIPGEVTNLLGGFLYGTVIGVLLSTIGLTIGSYVAFILGRILGRPFVERFVNKTIMKRFDYLLHHKGAFIVFLLFLIPGFPKDSLCYVLGLGHLSSAEFLVIGGVGRLFGTVLETLGGDYIRHDQYARLFILIGVALVMVLVAILYRDKVERLLRWWHVKEYKKKRMRQRKVHRSREKEGAPKTDIQQTGPL